MSATTCGVDLVEMASGENWTSYSQKAGSQMTVYGKVAFQMNGLTRPELTLQLKTDTRNPVWKNIEKSVQVSNSVKLSTMSQGAGA